MDNLGFLCYNIFMKKIYTITKLQFSFTHTDIHSHNCWEIVYYTHGSGKITFKGLNKVTDFEKGQLLIIPPKIEHAETSNSKFKNICILLPEFELNIHDPTFLNDNDSKNLLSIMKLMRDAFDEKTSPNSGPLLSALYYSLLAYIEILLRQSPLHPIVEQVKQLILKNYNNCDFSFDSVYKEIHFNPDYVRKLFTEQMQISPQNFLTEKRIEYAKKLLEFKDKNNYSINEIAYMSGYNDPFYFSRIFKKKTGLSPLEYTKKSITSMK